MGKTTEKVDTKTGEVTTDGGNLPVRTESHPIIETGVRPTPVGGLIGATPQDYNFPKLHLYQGTQFEKTAYNIDSGQHDDGTWIDAVTCQRIKVEDEIKIVPVFGFKDVAVWKQPMGAGFIGIYADIKDVPLEYIEDPDGYQVNKQLSWIMLVEKCDYPMIVVFKRTGYRAGMGFATMVDGRRAMGSTLGAYHLRSRQVQASGGVCYIPAVAPAGNAPEDMRTMAENFAMAFSGGRVVAQDVAEGQVESEIPI